MNFALRFCLTLLFITTTQFDFAQVKDSIYLMNGQVFGEMVVDSSLGAVTINDPKKPGKRLHYELDQLYKIRYVSGREHYYYSQDSSKFNWFTREEMGLFIKGEHDSRRFFKPKACGIAAGIFGFVVGMSGTFWGRILPYCYMAFSGITRIRIKHKTVSDPRFLDYDAYILGYERTARQKRKIWSVIGGSIGLVAGYGFYAAFHNKYPESAPSFLQIKL